MTQLDPGAVSWIPYVGGAWGAMAGASNNNPGANLGQQDGDYAPEHSEKQRKALAEREKAYNDASYNFFGVEAGYRYDGSGNSGAAFDPYGRAYRSKLDAAMFGLGQRKGPQVGEYGSLATMSGSAKVDPTRLSRGDELAMRAKQMELAGMLGATAKGEGPSIAGLQMQQNTEAALAANRANAAGLGRMNAGLAMRSLGQQQSQALSSAAMGSAALKMQEAQQAQGQLGGLLSGMRGADFAAAAKQADLSAAERMANAGFEQQAAMGNVDAANRYEAAKAQFGLGKAGLSLQDQAQRDAMTQYLMGSEFAANQADRDAKIRAWMAGKGQGLAQSQFDWQKQQAERMWDAQKWAATAGAAGKGAEMAGNWYTSQQGGGGGGGSAFEKYASGFGY